MRTPKVLVLGQTDVLCRQVERVTAGLRPRPHVEHGDTLDDLSRLSADAGPFDLVVAGPPMSEEGGLVQLRARRAQAPDSRLVLAVDRWPSESVRETLRTGASDILLLPVDDDDLLDALKQALDAPPEPRPRVGDTPPATRRHPGTVIVVLSATGGCGKTFLASNLAYQAHSRFGKQACLIDLDLQFGELSAALRLKPKRTITDLVSAEVDEDDFPGLLESHLVDHDSGIRLLAAPNEPADADAFEASHAGRIIEATRARFDYVIIDTGAALSDLTLAVLDHADEIYVLATLDLPSVRTLGILLATLKKLKIPTERISLLLNKVEPDVGIDVAGVSQYFPQGFSMVIPYGREVNRSLNMGQPVLAYAPDGEVSRSLDVGLSSMLAACDSSDHSSREVPEHPSLLRRRFGRRGKQGV